MIVQSDSTVLLEVDSPKYEAARDALARFAELEKSPEHIHTYRISPISLWNASAAGITPDEMVDALERFGKYEIPPNISREIADLASRYGRVKLEKDNGQLVLKSEDRAIIAEVWHNKLAQPYLDGRLDECSLLVRPHMRGHIKQALIRIGYPLEDLAGYVEGSPLPIALRPRTLGGEEFVLRDYQRDSAEIFYAGGLAKGGSGVIVLPCGAGKTVVGLRVMSLVQSHTLILATSIVAVRQWRREILDRTTLTEDLVGEYTGAVKDPKPVTLATYQILTHRKRKTDRFEHFELFTTMDWGLIVYDEVHLLPAPVFRITAEIQSRRRVGLTATLVREDGLEDDVFTLIGPKKYDVPWRVLEKQGWIAPAECTEIRIPLAADLRMEYAVSDQRAKFRIASENPTKLEILETLLQRHRSDLVLIIGQYLDQLHLIAEKVQAPIITGQTKANDREVLYGKFRNGELGVLVVSKVGNFAIDLPDANVAIQVSGTFGSRQEEAQRLGRILRPKKDGTTAHFYSLVTRDSRDQEFATKRQLFLTEQGYSYRILDHTEVLAAN